MPSRTQSELEVTVTRDRHAVRRPPGLAILTLSFVVVALAACGPTAVSTPPPTGPAAGVPTPVPTSEGPITPASPSPGGALPSQTETEWGRIWDELPATFPRYPGSASAEMREGPATAVLALPAEAGPAATYMQAALERSGYSTEAMSGPLEDGAVIIDSVGPTGACRVQTRLVPVGDSTVMTVFFGAGCPFD
jgi:hypothetical protein